MSPEAAAALAALRRVPGPSPWYLDRAGAQLPSNDGILRWESAGSGPSAAGKSLLRREGGDVLAVADFHCYVGAMGDRYLLVWYEEDQGAGTADKSAMRFRVLDRELLRPIAVLDRAYSQLGKHQRFYAEAGEVASIAISTALDDGVHPVSVPSGLHSAGELLVLAHSTAGGRRENYVDTMHLRLWVLDAAAGRLEIVPQDWFNHGAYDFGYQWVTRVARVPATREIVGEGIRLGVFKLDTSRRRVARWLLKDIFYHPRAEPSGDLRPDA